MAPKVEVHRDFLSTVKHATQQSKAVGSGNIQYVTKVLYAGAAHFTSAALGENVDVVFEKC